MFAMTGLASVIHVFTLPSGKMRMAATSAAMTR
jgi:hypothetical protein